MSEAEKRDAWRVYKTASHAISLLSEYGQYHTLLRGTTMKEDFPIDRDSENFYETVFAMQGLCNDGYILTVGGDGTQITVKAELAVVDVHLTDDQVLTIHNEMNYLNYSRPDLIFYPIYTGMAPTPILRLIVTACIPLCKQGIEYSPLSISLFAEYILKCREGVQAMVDRIVPKVFA